MTGQATGRTSRSARPVGELVRQWRERRRLSQLQLSGLAGVSTRHLSCVETGRANPSRELLIHLAGHLDLPLRERNRLLLAGGYAPGYAETPLDAPELAAVRAAVRQVLAGHEPYPAAVLDRGWYLVDANRSLALLTDLVAPALLRPPVNVLRASLHPDGLAPHIANLAQWRAHLLGRLRGQVEISADPQLTELLDELHSYPAGNGLAEPAGRTEPRLSAPDQIAVPLRIRYHDHELAFLSTIAVFGTALDVTVAELTIESFYPADAHTAAALRAHSDS